MVWIRRNRKPFYTNAYIDFLCTKPQDRTDRPIDQLRIIQDQLQRVTECKDERLLEVLGKYSELKKPVYGKRNQVIAKLEDFWLMIFLSHVTLGELLTQEDIEIFKYLDSLEVEESKGCFSDFCIVFKFKPNPFFENKKLTKTLSCGDEESWKVTGTDIKWKEGKGPVADDKKNGNKRPLPKDSFFNWFREPQHGEVDVVAHLIKNEVWANPWRVLKSEHSRMRRLLEEREGEKDSNAGSSS